MINETSHTAVWIVEDDASDQFIIREVVDKIEHLKFFLFDNAESFLDAFQKTKLSSLLIILDLNLPGINGHEIIEQLRKANIVTPIVVHTTSDHISDIELAYKFGANAYVVKSHSFEIFSSNLRAVIHSCLWKNRLK